MPTTVLWPYCRRCTRPGVASDLVTLLSRSAAAAFTQYVCLLQKLSYNACALCRVVSETHIGHVGAWIGQPSRQTSDVMCANASTGEILLWTLFYKIRHFTRSGTGIRITRAFIGQDPVQGSPLAYRAITLNG